MPDLAHVVGVDLGIGPDGALATSDGDQAVRERVLRRLLTNPAGYIWQLAYGGGLARAVGSPVDRGRVDAVIRSQLMLESAIARTPLPTTAVAAAPDGTVSVQVTYADAATGALLSTSFSVGSG